MNTFGVSLFKEPQEFIALYLGLQSHTPHFISYLQRLLHRTKSPPLAITYTYHFLKDKTQEQLSLDIIRFVSQLADVSPGVSMNSSLQDILTQSSFLTELRHSLTHKTMVKGTILLLGRSLILQQLQQKYWISTCNRLKQVYRINLNKVNWYFKQTYNSDYEGDLSWLLSSHPLEYFVSCTNYEYKEHIIQVIQLFLANKMTSSEFIKYSEAVNSQKQTIFVVLVLQTYITLSQQHEHFTHFVKTYIQKLPQSLFEQQPVKRQLLKCYFLKYLKHTALIIESLPAKMKEEIIHFWKQKQHQIGSSIYS